MARIDEFFRNPHPPPVSGLVVVVFAVVRDDHHRVLLVRRIDDGNWELPGGRVEVGEAASITVVREVAEEAGVEIEPTGDSGIYSDAETTPGRPPRRRPASVRLTPAARLVSSPFVASPTACGQAGLSAPRGWRCSKDGVRQTAPSP